MIGRDNRDDIDAYGIWAWLFGVMLCAFFIWVMFTFAAGIS